MFAYHLMSAGLYALLLCVVVLAADSVFWRRLGDGGDFPEIIRKRG